MHTPPDTSEVAPGILPGAPTPPLHGFTLREFQARRQALRAALPDGIIIIRGESAEDHVPYRQDPSFVYLTGVDAPGAALVLLPLGVPASAGLRDAAAGVRDVLFLPARNAGTETWTGVKPGPGAEMEASTGIDLTADAAGLFGAIASWVRRCPTVYTLPPYGPGARDSAAGKFLRAIQDQAPIASFRDAGAAVSRLRAVKSETEIAHIERAISVTAEGHRAALARIARGAGSAEYEVEADILQAFRSRRATPAFPCIVGAGVNGTVLHYEENTDILAEGDLVVVDIGARLGHYSGDVTRTYPAGGRFSPRHREIYGLVLNVHDTLVRSFRPGTDSLATLNERCNKLLAESPLRAERQGETAATMDRFMPHRVGHHLGTAVHDLVDVIGGVNLDTYASNGEIVPLPTGSVITIEPGVYLPEERTGVRLEDDYLVKETGLRRLGPPIPREIEEIEAAMRAAQ